MSKLYLDLETYSPVDIKKGVYRYAEESEILLMAYAIDDGPVSLWDATSLKPFPTCEVSQVVTKGGTVMAHNSFFDRVILAHSEYAHLFSAANWTDTMVRAYAHSLPGGLSMLSDILNLPKDQAKEKSGKALIKLFCCPNKDGSRNTNLTHPEKWEEFKNYATKDIEATRALDRKLPTWNDTPGEHALWLLDQKINDRGFQVDIDLAEKAVAALKVAEEENKTAVSEATGGEVGSATRRDQLLEFLLANYGVDLPDMQKSTLQRRVDDPNLPQCVRGLLALRLEASGTATTKYQTLLSSVSADGRLRGTLQFDGAFRTGRYAGRIFQPQNLPRPSLKHNEIEDGISAVRAGCADLLVADVKKLCSNALRSVICAPEGKKIVVADLSAIEGRVLAWLAGEAWKVKAYKDFDEGTQPYDMYVLTYAKTFRIAPEEVTKDQRQMGKVLELALGYGGGVGAFLTFANTYGMDLEVMVSEGKTDLLPARILAEALGLYDFQKKKNQLPAGLSKDAFVLCDGIKRMWREANPNIASFWDSLESAVKAVAQGFGGEHGTPVGRFLIVDKKGPWLRIQLPSGRYLSYPRIQVSDGRLRYQGMNTYSRKWDWLYTYGGKLAENVTQAVARDVLMYSMPRAEAEGYEVILTVHDEILAEVPDVPEYSAEGLARIMSAGESWSVGLPLAAGGFECKNYRKG